MTDTLKERAMSNTSEKWEQAKDQWFLWRRANPTQAIIVYAVIAVIVAFWIGVLVF